MMKHLRGQLMCVRIYTVFPKNVGDTRALIASPQMI